MFTVSLAKSSNAGTLSLRRLALAVEVGGVKNRDNDLEIITAKSGVVQFSSRLILACIILNDLRP